MTLNLLSGIMKNNYTLKIGLFAIGLEAYWPQFEGLQNRLEAYIQELDNRMSSYGPEIINLGLVDNTDKAFKAGHRFRQAEVDLIFLYVTTYALSSTVLPVVQMTKVPVIVLNLVPELAIDYEKFNALKDRTAMTGEWLAHCSPCSVPEIANVFSRTGIQFYQVTGSLQGDEQLWSEIGEWIAAAQVAHTMAHNRMGCMGHYYSGMLDIYSDLTQHYAHFGGHVEILEVDELSSLRHKGDADAIMDRIILFKEEFDIQNDCSELDLSRAAKTSLALDALVDKYQLGSLAYYYKGEGVEENALTMSTIILGSSLLTGRGVPVAGEYEIKNAQAMKILDSFGAGGSFTEYYALDLKEDLILMGHDGPGHIAIAEGKPKVKPLEVYHGKIGAGLSIEMSVKNGPVTLLSVVQDGGSKLKLLCAEGETVPGPILEIGNTNSRYKFKIGAREFVNLWNGHGPAHHCAVGIGHLSGKIEKLGKLLKMEVIRVC